MNSHYAELLPGYSSEAKDKDEDEREESKGSLKASDKGVVESPTVEIELPIEYNDEHSLAKFIASFESAGIEVSVTRGYSTEGSRVNGSINTSNPATAYSVQEPELNKVLAEEPEKLTLRIIRPEDTMPKEKQHVYLLSSSTPGVLTYLQDEGYKVADTAEDAIKALGLSAA